MPLDAMGTSMSMSSRRRKNNRRNHRNAAAAANENSDRPRSAPTIPAPRAVVTSCRARRTVGRTGVRGRMRADHARERVDRRERLGGRRRRRLARGNERNCGSKEKERRSAINLGTASRDLGARESETCSIASSRRSERPEMSKELRSSMKLEHTAREWARRVREQARAVADFAKELAKACETLSALRKHLCHLARGVASRTRGDVDRTMSRRNGSRN